MEQNSLTFMVYCLRRDAKRYGSRWKFHPGFWVILSYRIRRLRKHGPAWYLSLIPLDILAGLIRRIVSDTTLPSSMCAGPGLYLPHPSGIIINSKVKLNEDVTIFQQVTIGEWHGKVPEIGSATSIFAGAKVFGGIKIGDMCKIGANAVVNKNIPDNTSVSIGKPELRSRLLEVVKKCTCVE